MDASTGAGEAETVKGKGVASHCPSGLRMRIETWPTAMAGLVTWMVDPLTLPTRPSLPGIGAGGAGQVAAPATNDTVGGAFALNPDPVNVMSVPPLDEPDCGLSPAAFGASEAR
jgi:hypothetical protein